MSKGSGEIKGIVWGYDKLVVGSDSGSSWRLEMGILKWCDSVKKKTHRKFERGAWTLGVWRRLVVIFSGIDVGGVWIQSEVIKVNSGRWVG